MVGKERVYTGLPDVAFAELSAGAADRGIGEQVVESVPQVRQRAVATVTLQVTNQLLIVGVAPAPVTEGL